MPKIDIILLSILMEGPKHGYEIEQAITNRHMRKWVPVGTSSIYSGLERLEKKGLAEASLDTSQGLPARRVFSISEKGQAFLRDGAVELLRQGEYIYLDFNVGMVAYPYLEKELICTLAKQRRQQTRELIEDAEKSKPQPGSSAPEHAFWLWKHEYDLLQTELKWLEEFITFLEGQVGQDNQHSDSQEERQR